MGTIKICPDCKGEGTSVVTNNWYELESITCGRCKGSGKVYERNYNLEIPFDDRNSPAFFIADKDIMDSIINLKKSLTQF